MTEPASGLVLLASPGESTNIVWHALRSRFGPPTTILESIEGRWAFLRRRAARLGWATVLGQVAFMAGVVPRLRRASRDRLTGIRSKAGFDPRPIPDAWVRHVGSVNDPGTLSLIQDLAPRVVIVNGTRILSRSLLAGIAVPCLNLHAGITPLFRGVHGGYWALVEGRGDACGVTAHLVDPGIDSGGIVAQARIAPTPHDNFTTYPSLQLAAGVPLLLQAIADAFTGSLHLRQPPPGPSRLWSHPTLTQYLRYRQSRGVR